MGTMTINCPDWLPELSDEQMQGYSVNDLLDRYAKGVRFGEFRELFYYRWRRTSIHNSRGASWRCCMRVLGYTEDAGWCYVE